MSNKLDEIVDVRISIENPGTSLSSYSTMLLVVPAPLSNGTESLQTLTRVTSLDEIAAYGYTTGDTTASDYCVYEAVAMALSQDPGPKELYITVRGVTQETVDDTPTTVAESIPTVLDRVNGFNSWYGFALVGTYTNADLAAASTWAEANNKLFGFTWTGDAVPIALTDKDHTFALYAGDLDTTIPNAVSPYGAIAWMAKCFGYEPGSETWALKRLAGVIPSVLSSAKTQTITNAKSNYYHQVADRYCTQTGIVGSGEWIDIIRFRDWLVSQIQYKVAVFLTANTKVPYNDAGIAGVENVLESVLLEGQRVGGIDADMYEGDSVIPGYTITVPRSADIDPAEKKTRQLSNITFTARLAGAIHKTVIRGKLTY